MNLSIEGHVARVTLDRPEQHNAIEAQDVARFHTHLATVAANNNVRVLVLTGTGRTFCAGASLPQVESGELTPAMFEGLAEGLAATRVPSICALNGSAFGGGVDLALCCDFRIGIEGSKFMVPAAKLGLAYPLGGIRRFVATLGPAWTTRLLVAAEEMSAEEMLDAGGLHRVVPTTELDAMTRVLCERLAGLAPLAVQAMKGIVRHLAAGTLDAEEARALLARCATSEDLREGLAAWREGRAPRFQGW